MKFHKLAAALVLIAAAAPASAQSVPDDARCLLLANGFGKTQNNDKAREVANEAMIFYVGRLDGRANDPAITNAIRAQTSTIDPKTAGREMDACVIRLARAKQRIQHLGQAAAQAPRR